MPSPLDSHEIIDLVSINYAFFSLRNFNHFSLSRRVHDSSTRIFYPY